MEVQGQCNSELIQKEPNVEGLQELKQRGDALLHHQRRHHPELEIALPIPLKIRGLEQMQVIALCPVLGGGGAYWADRNG